MMHLYRPPRWKIVSFLMAMPVISLALNLIMFREKVWHDLRIWYFSIPLICLIGFVSWYSHVLHDLRCERRYPGLADSRKRILSKVLVMLYLMPPSILATFALYHHLHLLGYQIVYSHIPEALAVGLSINLIFRTLYEGEYIFEKYKENKREREMMTQVSVYQELDTLKNQINPHFLFNCFNTLSSLISIDKDRAEEFLNELSKVYRYLLRNNKEGLSTVGNEIRFIQSYFKLLQTRHGDAVRLNIQIDKQYEAYHLPSLTLQLLVENAVKHNMLSKSRPLVVDIFTTAGNKLVVNNNLQRRMIKALSNMVGLENIRAKYQLLQQSGFQVMEDEKNFTVVLPLIWKMG